MKTQPLTPLTKHHADLQILTKLHNTQHKALKQTEQQITETLQPIITHILQQYNPTTHHHQTINQLQQLTEQLPPTYTGTRKIYETIYRLQDNDTEFLKQIQNQPQK